MKMERIGLLGLMGLMLVSCEKPVDRKIQVAALQEVETMAGKIITDRYVAETEGTTANPLAAVDYQAHLAALATAKKGAAAAGASPAAITKAAEKGRSEVIEFRLLLNRGIIGAEEKVECLERLRDSEL